MKAVVLAAGTGCRLGALGGEKPKALFPFNGFCMIDYVLAFLDQPEIDEVFVVGGFQFSLLKAHLERHEKRIRLIENKEFLKGNIVTLATALPRLSDDFLLLNSDHLYPETLIRRVVEGPEEARIVCDRERPLGADDMKVLWDGNSRVEAISKTLESYDGGYIGMTFIPKDALPAYRRAFGRVLTRSNGAGVAEEVVGEMIGLKEAPRIHLIDPIDWIEIDTPEDLRVAEAKIASGKVVLKTPV